MSATGRPDDPYLGAWLSDRLLLLAGPGDGDGEPPTQVSLAVDGHAVEAETVLAPADARSARSVPQVVLVRLGAAFTNGRQSGAVGVEVQIDGERLSVPGPRAGMDVMGLSSLLRNRLTSLETEPREHLMDFIARGCAADLEGPGRATLADRLKLIRDALRERFPPVETGEDVPRSLALDDILALDDHTYWIKGWVWDAENRSPALEVISPEGARKEILEGAFRWRRKDIEQLHAGFEGERALNGFVACVTLPIPSRTADGWIARLVLPGGDGVEAAGPEVVRPALVVRDAILRDLTWTDREKDRMVSDYAFPAIRSLLARRAASIDMDQSFQYGEAVAEPDTSIIVTLADRFDAIEHHLINFRADPEVCAADLIYVTDAQEGIAELLRRLKELHWLYPVPFRLVTLTAQASPVIAKSIGASLARAQRLLFLSPDVMPERAGWLGAMAAAYDALPAGGALGPRLVFEDGSLQHAGLGFEPISPEEMELAAVGSDVWQTRGFFKGLPRDFPGAVTARQVPAISGACMMIGREPFDQVGGFRNSYVYGEYEDVDLCMRLREAGRENWYTPEATLYHLEGRSEIVPPLMARQYNVLLLSHLWRDQIERSTDYSD